MYLSVIMLSIYKIFYYIEEEEIETAAGTVSQSDVDISSLELPSPVEEPRIVAEDLYSFPPREYINESFVSEYLASFYLF